MTTVKSNAQSSEVKRETENTKENSTASTCTCTDCPYRGRHSALLEAVEFGYKRRTRIISITAAVCAVAAAIGGVYFLKKPKL